MTWCVLDLETQNHEYYGSLASPHHPQNYIVAAAFAHDDAEVQSWYFNSAEEAASSDWLQAALADQKVLVAHNATFEIHWLLKTYPVTFLNWLKQGGRIFCTQYAEYLLSNQQELYPSLEDCSLKYGGSKKIDAVKLLWEQGVLTADIDEALLMEYLAGSEGDIENTRTVLFSQVPALQERGMYEMFKLRMDSLVFNAFSTFNGLYVDVDTAYKNMHAQLEEIEEIRSNVLSMMPDNVPEDLDFKFTSHYHMSAFMYGGTVQYSTKVPYDPIKFEKDDFYKDINGKLYPVSAGFPADDVFLELYRSGKNKGQPKVFREDTEVQKLKNGTKQYVFPGLISIPELPSIVSEQFLGKRAEFRGKRTLVDGTPVYSTGTDALNVLVNYTDAAKPLKKLAALLKDTGTYYLMQVTDDEGNVIKQSGMLQYVEPDGLIHHQLNNCATVTTRLSGSRPNAQNIPRDGTSRVKEMFSSRFGADGCIVEVDYSALEVVAMAAISGDMNLMQQLLDGTDMHCYRLAGSLNEPYDEVYEKCHNEAHPEHKQYKQLRTDTKPRAFANQYGASAAGIAYATGCSVEEAELFQETERKLFPESSMFAEKYVRPEVERTGVNCMHREMYDDGSWGIYRVGHFRAKGGTCYSFRQYPKYINGQNVLDYKDTQLANYWCQGEASFIVQAACARVIRELMKRNFADGKVLPINTVHDAIYLDCATEELAREYGLLVQRIMEETPKAMCEVMPEYKDWRYDTTPFPAACEMGKNMMSKHSIKETV